MENPFQIFNSEQFGKIRATFANDQLWLVGADVGKALGYVKTEDAIKRHVRKEDKRFALVPLYTPNKPVLRRHMVIINESGLYSLVLSSKMPEAQEFKAWVTSEVLPAFRKAGLCSAEQILEQLSQSATSAETVQRCVYALEMSNGTTKIGSTQDLKTRVQQIQSSSGLQVLNSFHSDYFEKSAAIRIEKDCHKTFSDQRVQGEFFSTTFQEAKAEVEIKTVEHAVVAETDKVCVYVLQLSSNEMKIGVTNDILECACTIERQSGFKVMRIYNSDMLPKVDALKIEKLLHDKFSNHRLEGEFFSASFEEGVRELERTIAELHLFEPLALPDVNLADKLFSYANEIQNPTAKDRILVYAANLLVGQNVF